jgi:hypothetical protein
MKITDRQYVVSAFLVVCLVIVSNAIIYKNIIDILYLVFLLSAAIRLYLIEKHE